MIEDCVAVGTTGEGRCIEPATVGLLCDYHATERGGGTMSVYVTPAEVEAARYLVRHGDTRASVRRIAEAGR